MNPNVIQFACGHCQSWLTVPAHLAGVTGPCPKCGQQISSPRESQPQPQAPTAGVYAAPVPSQPVQPLAPPSMPPPWEQAPQAVQPAAPMSAQPHQLHQPLGSTGLNQGTAAPRPQQPTLNAGMAPLWPGQQGAQPLQPMQPVNPFPLGMQPSSPESINTPPVWAQPPFPTSQPSVPVAPAAPMPWEQPAPASIPTAGTALPTSKSIPQPGSSRPVTSAGSRLSLLARQLSTTTVLAQDLPQPDSIRAEDLAPAIPPVALPDGSRARAAGDMILKSKMRLGSGVSTSSSGSGRILKTLATAAVLSGLVGGAWYYRSSARSYLLSLLQPNPPISSTVVTTAPVVPPPDITPPVTAPDPIAPGPQPTSVAPKKDEAEVVTSPTPPVPQEKPLVDTKAPTLEQTPAPSAPPSPPVPPAPMPPTVPRALVVNDEPPAPEIRPGIPTPKDPNAPNSPKALVEVNVNDAPPTGSGVSQTSSQPSTLGNNPKINNCPPAAKAALEGLLGFLGADSLARRLPFMQQAEGIQAKAEQYYRTNPDGPILVNEINYLRRDVNPEVGQGSHTVFVVDSRSWAYPIPVMLEENETGARVDWLSFIEFKDDLLKRFFSGYIDQPARFHVAIRRTHYFNDNVPDLDNKECFEITNAMGTISGHVFVPKPSPLVTSLASSITWDKASVFPIVELQWRKEPGYQWIEMTAVPQLNWYSANAKPAPGL